MNTRHTAMRYLAAVLLVIGLTACDRGADESAPPDTSQVARGEAPNDASSADSDTSLAALPEALADDDGAPGTQPLPGAEDGQDSASEPGESADRSERTPPSPMERDDAPGPPPLPARYQLAYVEGEALPVTVDESPDCRVEIVHGDLWIKEDHSFELRASSRTMCNGEAFDDALNTAGGTVSRDGRRLRFEATSGEFFATATGSYTVDGHIDVSRLIFEGEETPVHWRFIR